MGNQFHVPSMVEYRVRHRFRRCAYCGRRMKAHKRVRGCPGDKATIEHLNRQGPFYWSEGLQEKDLVMVCARCNSSRGARRLSDWFESTYCRERSINPRTVASPVKRYLKTAVA